MLGKLKPKGPKGHFSTFRTVRIVIYVCWCPEFSLCEWLFPALLLADLDLEPLNLADQFVLSCLAGDVFPWYAGGFPPGTVD